MFVNFSVQAGDNHHFHPTCARCTKCGDPFGDGEEMYLQGEISFGIRRPLTCSHIFIGIADFENRFSCVIGGAIWHPKCGPGPTENGTIINGLGSGSHIALNGNLTDTDREFDRLSSSAASETQVCLGIRRSTAFSSSGFRVCVIFYFRSCCRSI